MEKELDTNIIFSLIRNKKLINDLYVKVNLQNDIAMYFHILDILKEKTGLIIVKKEEAEKQEEKEKFISFVPNSKLPLYNRIKEILANIDRFCYNYLTTLEGTPVNIEEVLPKHWNHIKDEYIAEVLPTMNRKFISKRYGFTSSGANAKLEYDLPTEIGCIIVAKNGSYKHLYHSFYRLSPSGWNEIYSVEEAEWQNVLGKLLQEILIKEIQ